MSKINSQQEKNKLANTLYEKKNLILQHLIEEQNFKIAMNSVDPKLALMKTMFTEIQEFMGKHVKELKDNICINQKTITKLESR